MPNIVPAVGTVFHRLTFLGLGSKKDHWIVQCSCGSDPKLVYRYHILSGTTKSCGCYHKQRIQETFVKHGAARASHRTRGFRSWASMKNRCSNPNNKNFNDYGGRGITYCDSWAKFENFIADMGEPGPRETLERIDVNKGYCLDNCIWIDFSQQNKNKRNSRMLTLNGKTQSMASWAEELGLNYSTIRSRLRYGWSDEEALLGR